MLNMELILWRHAEAEDDTGEGDLARKLTPKGRQQAAHLALWLKSRLPKQTILMSSEAVRAQQTLRFLSRDTTLVPALNPDQSPASLLEAIKWPQHPAVLVVGHQPTLGLVASHLLGSAQPWSLKKGAMIWLTHRIREDIPQTILRCAIAPDFL